MLKHSGYMRRSAKPSKLWSSPEEKQKHPMRTDRLYQQYSKSIRTYLMRFVNETEANDLTQEVFVKVGNNLDRFRGEASIKTWIYRIASNTVKDFLKSRAYRTSLKQVPISETELEGCDASLASGSSIDEKLDASAMNQCIREFIHRLPINYSTVLVLSDLEELSSKEVAEILNQSVGTVKMRLHRARARLKTELEEGCVITTGCDNKLLCERK